MSKRCESLFNCLSRFWKVCFVLYLQQTFHYDSDFWKNNEEFNLPESETEFDSQETKLPTYWETPFSKICLGMACGQQIRFIIFNKQADSLYSLIVDGQHRATSLRRQKWKSLIGPEGSLQPNCNTQGFNAVGTSSAMSKAWIGIIGKEQNECNNCESRNELGTGGSPDDSKQCTHQLMETNTSKQWDSSWCSD